MSRVNSYKQERTFTCSPFYRYMDQPVADYFDSLIPAFRLVCHYTLSRVFVLLFPTSPPQFIHYYFILLSIIYTEKQKHISSRYSIQLNGLCPIPFSRYFYAPLTSVGVGIQSNMFLFFCIDFLRGDYCGQDFSILQAMI